MCAFHCPLQGIPFIDLQCRALHFTRHAALLNNNQSFAGEAAHAISNNLSACFGLAPLIHENKKKEWGGVLWAAAKHFSDASQSSYTFCKQ